MTDEEGIRRTIAQYAHFCDDGRFEDWADLYTEDARFSVLGQTHEGRETIKNWIANAQPPEQRGKHVCFSSVIDVDGDQARAWTDYIFVSQAKTITSVGRYHDRFVRQTDRWRFTERRIVFMGDDA
jgi:3-phenylpropionate/cinnamic acid dioxygenase small subunit